MLQRPAEIDHVVVNVHDRLDEALAQYRRLGFTLTDRGHHTLGTSNHLAMFGRDYLELLGFEPGRAQQRRDVWRDPAGLAGLVFKPPSGADLSADLLAAGVDAEPSRSFSRPVRVPGGEQDARFSTTTLPKAVSNGRVYFCHHFTPELVWRPEWQAHANGVTGILGFVIAAADPAGTAAVFGRMFGSTALTAVEGGLALQAKRAQVLFLAPGAVARRYDGAAAMQDDGADRMVALDLQVSSLPATRAALDDGQVPAAMVDGMLVVPAQSAFGVALAFRA